MRCLVVLSAVLCVAQPWWIANFWIRYPFLRQASLEARSAFNNIDKNGTLTKAQREEALDKWAAQYNLVNITTAQEREAIAKLCESLDPATRQAVDYLLRLYGSRPGFSGFGFSRSGLSRLFDAPFFPLSNGASRSLLW
ncbi:hypothetical protein OSTOST_10569 [Ostertagia ostertagi]